MKKPDSLTTATVDCYWRAKLLTAALLASLSLTSGPAAAAVFQGETLVNGTRVYVAHTPGHQRTVFRLGSTVGPDDSPCYKLQLAHLTEHLMFEGLGAGGQESLMRLMDRHAGEINAVTHPTAVTVVGYVHSRFALKTVDLLADAITYRDSINAVLERERKIIKAELEYTPINNHIGHSNGTLYDLLTRRSPGECGLDRSITKLTAEDVAAFWKDLFDPRNLTLYISSDVPAEQLMPAVHQAFGSRPETGRAIPATTRNPIPHEGDLSTIRWTLGDKTTLGAIVYVNPNDINVMAQDLLLLLLQIETDEAVRQQGGHTYHVSVSYRPSNGAISISTTPRPGEEALAMAALKEAISRVLSGHVPERVFTDQRSAHALRVSAYATSPELNIDNASWRAAALDAGVDVVDTSDLEQMSQHDLAAFAAAWVIGEPVYVVERRPASYVPWWAIAALIVVMFGIAIPWKSARAALSSLRNKYQGEST